VFLNKTSAKIIEIANRVFKIYNGNYDYYVEEKKNREEMQLQQHTAQAKYIQKSQAYVDAFEYGSPIMNSKATWLKKMLANLERIEKPDEIVKPEFKFKYAGKLPKTVLELENLEVGYTQPILPPISLKLEKGEKCIIRGFNGIGKTTLLKTISLEHEALSGEIYYGEGIKAVFFKQEEDYENNFSSFDRLKEKTMGIKKGKAREITAIEFITEYYPEKSQSELKAALSRCGIKGDMMFSRVRTLSGGEMTKLRLCIAMLREVNLIILDEPTNHLDVYSKEVLLNALSEFDGNVLMTSHDVNFDISWAAKTIDLEEIFG
jgi:ATPase subunit of ABC transporter with duplicated ATPase domains